MVGRVRRTQLRIRPDCDRCPIRRTCVVLSQIEEDFTLTVLEAPTGLRLTLSCSEYRRVTKSPKEAA